MFTERPERLIGSAALASLLGGVPLALIFSVWGAIEGGMSISPLHFVGWAFGIAGICFALSFIIAVPSLALLRRLRCCVSADGVRFADLQISEGRVAITITSDGPRE